MFNCKYRQKQSTQFVKLWKQLAVILIRGLTLIVVIQKVNLAIVVVTPAYKVNLVEEMATLALKAN